jgi:glutathione S-transferase
MTEIAAGSEDEPIFHLALPEDWQSAFETGEYRWSTRGKTLDVVGFIHCSTSVQIASTATSRTWFS